MARTNDPEMLILQIASFKYGVGYMTINGVEYKVQVRPASKPTNLTTGGKK